MHLCVVDTEEGQGLSAMPLHHYLRLLQCLFVKNMRALEVPSESIDTTPRTCEAPMRNKCRRVSHSSSCSSLVQDYFTCNDADTSDTDSSQVREIETKYFTLGVNTLLSWIRICVFDICVLLYFFNRRHAFARLFFEIDSGPGVKTVIEIKCQYGRTAPPCLFPVLVA